MDFEASAGPATSDISTVCIPPALMTALTVTLPVIAHLTFVVAIPF